MTAAEGIEDRPRARLVQGSVSWGLFRLTLPMIAGISATIIVGLLEAWYLAQVSTAALIAYSFTFPVAMALMSLSLGISIGVSSVLARTVGEGDQTQVRRLASDGLALAAAVMLAVSLLGAATIRPLFRLLGADDASLPLIEEYMLIWYLSLVFMSVPAVGASAMRATGDAGVSGTIMVAGSALQGLLGPLFIFGLAGLPALGLTGAAIATLVARLAIFAVTLAVLHHRERLLSYRDLTLAALLASWRRILAVSLPATATNMIGPFSNAIIVSLLADFSQETVAGYGIASRIESVFIIPLFALSASIGPFTGQNWGSGRLDRANAAMKLAFRYALVWGALVAALLMAFRHPIAAFFDGNPAVVGPAASYLLIVPLSYGAWGMLMMASAIFNSLGKPIRSTIMSAGRMLVVYVPLAYLGKALYGVPGIFAACCAANLCMGLLALLWNRRTYGKAGAEGAQ